MSYLFNHSMYCLESFEIDRIIAILEQECGAGGILMKPLRFTLESIDNEHYRLPLEYRFCGKLGLGGKLHITDFNIRVSCYPEDMTPEREAMVNRANERLQSEIISGHCKPRD